MTPQEKFELKLWQTTSWGLLVLLAVLTLSGSCG